MDKLLAAKYRERVDSREQPLYTVKEAADYLGNGSQTLNTWLFGRPDYTKSEGKKFCEPVIIAADPELKLLERGAQSSLPMDPCACYSLVRYLLRWDSPRLAPSPLLILLPDGLLQCSRS